MRTFSLEPTNLYEALLPCVVTLYILIEGKLLRSKELQVPIPPLTDKGVLPNVPTGIHECTLEEIQSEFGNSYFHPKRELLWVDFLSFIQWIRGAGIFSTVYVNGSFTKDKGSSRTVLSTPDPPNDIDAILQMPPPSPSVRDVLMSKRNRKILDQAYIKSTFQVHLFFYHSRTPPNKDFREFFQSVKIEEALDRGLPSGSRKGILKVKL